ncbi:GNAT family N-acetyltransferase [Sinimarinibacterium sp. CAU 1509]|uniref:GNAT family N-acetyltransferase n=1 Tax=Sinimarinibacterium sp. CAU 1509 TaxID=2562283 RepID=UPI00200AE459|nr:GNAT family N-acetyltransferase [Sinimarinibacterium sp. CAU 1509]
MTETIELQWTPWAQFSPDLLYACLKLRSDIFVVEQQCPYSDMDGLDPQCEHLSARTTDGRVDGYLRLLPPGLKSATPALGRLVVAAPQRGTGLGRRLMLEGLRHCALRYPGQSVFLSGQQHLQAFYASLGFAPISDPYLEDDIPHVDMLLTR